MDNDVLIIESSDAGELPNDAVVSEDAALPLITELPDETDLPDDADLSSDSSASAVPKKRRRIGFYGVSIIIMLVFFIGIGFGAVYLWGYISDYEASRIEHVIDYLQDNTDYSFWEQSVERAIAARLNEFETDGAVPLQPHIDKIRDVRYVYRQKSDETSPEAPVYIVRAGALDIGIVRFVATEEIGHGFSMWEVASIEFLDSFIDTFPRSIAITASINAKVLLNGIEVSEKYLVDCEYEYGATYKINGLYGDASVSVFEFDGAEPDLMHLENGWYFYPITIPFSRQYNFVIPDNGSILVNGEPVTPDKVTDRGIVPDVFIGAIDPDRVPSFLYRYEFSLEGLYTEPEISVLDALGRDLVVQSSNSFETRYIEDFSAQYKDEHTATVDAFIRAYVNFAANVGGNIGGNISNLNRYILRDSELYRRVQASRAAMEWVGGITVIYNELTIDSFRPYGDNFFSCEASYNITNRTSYGNRELIGCFEILFHLSGERWLAVNMVAI